MARLFETDEQVTFSKQLDGDISGPVILINKFTVDPEDVNKFLKAWANDAEYFKHQPGFISSQLHRGIGGSQQPAQIISGDRPILILHHTRTM